MTAILIKGGAVITPLEEITADCRIENGLITAVAPAIPADGADLVDASGLYVVPGHIDLHIQGHEGRDFWERTADAAHFISHSVVKHGVTAITPTTDGFVDTLAPVAQAAEEGPPGAQFVGIHSEGPFVSLERPGAIGVERIRPVDMDLLKSLLDASRGLVRIMTVAPELPGALEVIRFLRENDVSPSLGHSQASFQEANAAFDAGATRVTHLFNAMTGFADRPDGGLLAAALLRDDVLVEMVCDAVHVHPALLHLVARAKGVRKTTAITDSVKVAGLPPGQYSSGGHGYDVFVDAPGNPPRLADGTIAGSSLSMDQAVRNLVHLAGLSLTETFTMASYAPAATLGLLGKKGEVAPGCDADIVLYDRDLNVRRTYVAGDLKFKN